MSVDPRTEEMIALEETLDAEWYPEEDVPTCDFRSWEITERQRIMSVLKEREADVVFSIERVNSNVQAEDTRSEDA